MSSYVYIRSEPGLWTVGFYDSDGQWEPESDHSGSEEAARRAAWLNGAPSDHHLLVDELKELRAEVAKLREQTKGGAA